MSDTRQHEVIEALVSIFTAAVDVPVYDGPNAVQHAQFTGVWVGYDPTDDDGEAVSVTQQYVNIGNFTKEEVGDITCCIAAWSGDTSTLGRRVKVAGLFSQLEAAVRTDIGLGQVVIDSNFGERSRLLQRLTEEGNEVVALFNVAYRARI